MGVMRSMEMILAEVMKEHIEMAGFIEVRVEEEETAMRAKKHECFKEGVKIWERGMQICEWNALYLRTQRIPRDLCYSAT